MRWLFLRPFATKISILIALAASSCLFAEEGGPDSRFSATLGEQVAAVQQEILLSPMSVWRAMALLSLGARGKTQEELQNFLGVSNEESLLQFMVQETHVLYPEVKTASGIFSSPFIRLRQEYLERIKETCPDATFASCDFQKDPEGSCAFINKWISGKTLGRISNIVTPMDIGKDTVSAVVNALAFQASWKSPFNKEKTKKAPFFSPEGEKEVLMMEKKERTISYKDEEISYVELEYKPEGEGRFVLELLMAKEGKKNPLMLFEKARAGKKDHLLRLKVPKMKLKERTLLNLPLQNMGLARCFSSAADFSRFAAQPLSIQKVLHQVSLDVFEEGTEGAAATVALMNRSAVPGGHVEEIAFDHPFWLILREKTTGSCVFYSFVTSPQGK